MSLSFQTIRDRLRLRHAAQVRSILGNSTGLTYAADWSEYFGHQPEGAANDFIYHLDPLWSDSHIDYVGIDAYFPLSDWREGEAHLDKERADTVYDLTYLSSQIEGGEGYDYYYASPDDRTAQRRTPITHARYRYKDMRSWWQSPHENIIGGVKTLSPWQAQSKPIWLTEIGCPAIDKGANQPNVFVDPKSSESHVPYHSSGARDDLMQRRYLEAILSYWADDNVNPTSSVTGLPMLDVDTACVWCWDARPYPDFPARKTVRGDGPNWQTGHWLNGRTGLVPLADILTDICSACDATVDSRRVHGLVTGYCLGRPMTGRAAIEPLLSLFGVTARESAGGLAFTSYGAESELTLALSDLVLDQGSPIQESYPDRESVPLDVRLHFIDADHDYQSASADVRHAAAETVRVIDISAPVVLDVSSARNMAAAILAVKLALRQVSFHLSPARLDVEVGDVVTLPDLEGRWLISEISAQNVVARAALATGRFSSGITPKAARAVPWINRPEIKVIDIPHFLDGPEREGPLIAAAVRPFSPVRVTSEGGDVTLSRPAAWGQLLTPLRIGPITVWDMASRLEVYLPGRDLASVTPSEVLNGANSFAVTTDAGFEIVQAAHIELIAADTYRLSQLLRGRGGSDSAMMDEVPAGREVIWLDDACQPLSLGPQYLGAELTAKATAAGRDSAPLQFHYQGRHLLPLSPCHVKACVQGGALEVQWIRRTRLGGEAWTGIDVPIAQESEFYRVQFYDVDIWLASFEVQQPSLSLNAAQWSELSSATRVEVAQGSLVAGFGPPKSLFLKV